MLKNKLKSILLKGKSSKGDENITNTSLTAYLNESLIKTKDDSKVNFVHFILTDPIINQSKSWKSTQKNTQSGIKNDIAVFNILHDWTKNKKITLEEVDTFFKKYGPGGKQQIAMGKKEYNKFKITRKNIKNDSNVWSNLKLWVENLLKQTAERINTIFSKKSPIFVVDIKKIKGEERDCLDNYLVYLLLEKYEHFSEHTGISLDKILADSFMKRYLIAFSMAYYTNNELEIYQVITPLLKKPSLIKNKNKNKICNLIRNRNINIGKISHDKINKPETIKNREELIETLQNIKDQVTINISDVLLNLRDSNTISSAIKENSAFKIYVICELLLKPQNAGTYSVDG